MLTYKDSGVDIDAGNRLVDRIRERCPNIGGFGGLFPFGSQYLVGCTDGVGTKVKIAIEQGKHSGIGQDLVAMCVNDLVTTGARPLFFLDYYASSQLDVEQAAEVITSIADACESVDCALLGGETAEMPGMYKKGDYDLCGFAVGAVEKSDLIDGSTITPGDCLVGLPSSGIHSNGYSLVRKILESQETPLESFLPELGRSLEEELLTPTRLYVHEALRAAKKYKIRGIAHITGGGLEENASRVLPKGMSIEVDWTSWARPPIFTWLQEQGGVSEEEMRRTFNMGIGMVFVVPEEEALHLADTEKGFIIGKVVSEEGSR